MTKQQNNNIEKKSLIKFPCDFTIKVFGEHNSTCISDTEDIVEKHFPGLNQDKFEVRDSKGSKYCAIQVKVYVQSQEQLDELYTDLSKCPSTLMVL